MEQTNIQSLVFTSPLGIFLSYVPHYHNILNHDSSLYSQYNIMFIAILILIN